MSLSPIFSRMQRRDFEANIALQHTAKSKRPSHMRLEYEAIPHRRLAQEKYELEDSEHQSVERRVGSEYEHADGMTAVVWNNTFLVVYGGPNMTQPCLLHLDRNEWQSDPPVPSRERKKEGVIHATIGPSSTQGEPRGVIWARSHHTSVILSDYMIVFGGTILVPAERALSDTYFPPSSQWYAEYDLEACRWNGVSCVGDIPAPRSHHTATLVRHEMYVLGGKSTPDPTQPQHPAATATQVQRALESDFYRVYVLSVPDQVWRRIQTETIAPCVWGHTTVWCGAYLIMLGGFDVLPCVTQLQTATELEHAAEAVLCNRLYFFHLATQQWTYDDEDEVDGSKAVLWPSPRALHAAHSWGDHMIIHGGVGIDEERGESYPLHDCYIYAVDNSEWFHLDFCVPSWTRRLSALLSASSALPVRGGDGEDLYFAPRLREGCMYVLAPALTELFVLDTKRLNLGWKSHMLSTSNTAREREAKPQTVLQNEHVQNEKENSKNRYHSLPVKGAEAWSKPHPRDTNEQSCSHMQTQNDAFLDSILRIHDSSIDCRTPPSANNGLPFGPLPQNERTGKKLSESCAPVHYMDRPRETPFVGRSDQKVQRESLCTLLQQEEPYCTSKTSPMRRKGSEHHYESFWPGVHGSIRSFPTAPLAIPTFTAQETSKKTALPYHPFSFYERENRVEGSPVARSVHQNRVRMAQASTPLTHTRTGTTLDQSRSVFSEMNQYCVPPNAPKTSTFIPEEPIVAEVRRRADWRPWNQGDGESALQPHVYATTSSNMMPSSF